MRLAAALAAAFLLCMAAACVKTDNRGVTVTLPSAPPSATEIIKDGLLAAKVRAQVVTTDIEAAARLGVQVHSGDVRISGVVRSSQERDRIDRAVRSINGVKSLDNEIRVNPKAGGFSGGDFALATRVTAALAAQTGVNATRLRASAQDGVVTVSGTAPSPSIKQTALETVRKTGGVKRVVDKIRVEP
jgi:osmotically-inducible protein OsmY